MLFVAGAVIELLPRTRTVSSTGMVASPGGVPPSRSAYSYARYSLTLSRTFSELCFPGMRPRTTRFRRSVQHSGVASGGASSSSKVINIYIFSRSCMLLSENISRAPRIRYRAARNFTSRMRHQPMIDNAPFRDACDEWLVATCLVLEINTGVVEFQRDIMRNPVQTIKVASSPEPFSLITFVLPWYVSRFAANAPNVHIWLPEARGDANLENLVQPCMAAEHSHRSCYDKRKVSRYSTACGSVQPI